MNLNTGRFDILSHVYYHDVPHVVIQKSLIRHGNVGYTIAKNHELKQWFDNTEINCLLDGAMTAWAFEDELEPLNFFIFDIKLGKFVDIEGDTEIDTILHKTIRVHSKDLHSSDEQTSISTRLSSIFPNYAIQISELYSDGMPCRFSEQITRPKSEEETFTLEFLQENFKKLVVHEL